MPSAGTAIHMTALDGIVNVNSLFTLAVFIGLTWNPTDPSNTLIEKPESNPCTPDRSVAEDLVAFHVYSFSAPSSSPASSHWASSRGSASPGSPPTTPPRCSPGFARVNSSLLLAGMLVSGLGSVCGCVFLMLALVNVVQIKLGTLACKSYHTLAAVIPLVIFVPIALLVYVVTVLYAFIR